MVQPINYMLDIKSPVEQALKGYQQGFNIRAAEEARAAEQQTQQANMAAQQAQMQRQRQLQSDLTAFLDDPAADMESGSKLLLKYPEYAKTLKIGMEGMDEAKRKNTMQRTMQGIYALKAGQTEIAKDLLAEEAEAARNAGDDITARQFENVAKMVDISPKQVEKVTDLWLGSNMTPEEFADYKSKIGKERRAEELQPLEIEKQQSELRKEAANLGLTKAQTTKVLKDAEKLGLETKKALVDLEAQKSKPGAIIDPEKRFNAEKKLRDEYQKKLGTLTDSRDAYNKILISGQTGTGPGDIALVTSFMKMLDPGSVVRETEFATARDTAGIFERLSNIAQKNIDATGAFLNDNQRKSFINLAKEYMEAANKEKDIAKNSVLPSIKTFGLSEENVFGIEDEAKENEFVIPDSISVGSRTFTADDIRETARIRNITEEEVVNRLQGVK